MIRINLIPPEIHAAEIRKQISILGGAVAVVAVSGLLSVWALRLVKAHKLELQRAQAQAELAKYQAIVDKVNALEQTRNQLQARRDVIQQLLKGRLIYPKFFEDFMGILPPEIWITSLGTNMDAEGALTVNVGAQSLSNFAIADWLTNLQTSPLCGGVVLGTISATESPEGLPPLLTFSMTFHYRRKEA